MEYKYYVVALIAAAIVMYLVHKYWLLEGEGYNNKKEIPLYIHQIWDDLYPKMAKCVEKLKSDNPEFEHFLYNDDKCKKIISENFDKNVLCAYNNIIPLAFKADLVRYCILYVKGGIYIDIKYQMENGHKLIDYVDKEYYTTEALGREYIYNGFIISKPKNPLWLKCINAIVNNVNTDFYGEINTAPTGPALVYKLFDKTKYDEIIFKYDEENGKGFIINEKSGNKFMSHYPEYREEQQKYRTVPYWKDLWAKKNIYGGGKCK